MCIIREQQGTSRSMLALICRSIKYKGLRRKMHSEQVKVPRYGRPVVQCKMYSTHAFALNTPSKTSCTLFTMPFSKISALSALRPGGRSSACDSNFSACKATQRHVLVEPRVYLLAGADAYKCGCECCGESERGGARKRRHCNAPRAEEPRRDNHVAGRDATRRALSNPSCLRVRQHHQPLPVQYALIQRAYNVVAAGKRVTAARRTRSWQVYCFSVL